MTTDDMKIKIQELLNECPERKVSAVRAAESDAYNCYSWDDYSYLIKDYCYSQVDFYNLVAEGNAEKIAAFIESEVESLRKSFIRKIEEVNDWY
jgi:hypothetical protein